MKKPEERAHAEEALVNLNDSERQMVEKLFAEELTAQLSATLRSLKAKFVDVKIQRQEI